VEESHGRTLLAEVPANVADFFYVEFNETDEGVLYPAVSHPPPDFLKSQRENYPLLSEPIVIPESATSVQPKSWFTWHLVLYGVLPVMGYAVLLVAVCSIWPLESAWITVIHFLAVGVGCSVVWCRYRTSVLPYEVIGVACLELLSMLLAVLVNGFFGAFLRRYLRGILVAPVIEEITKYIPLRCLGFSDVVMDGNAMIAYGCISGLVFGLIENILYVGPGRNLDRNPLLSSFPNISWIRAFSVVGHVCYATISAARIAEWRFLGKHGGMFAVIWPSILLHALNNSIIVHGLVFGISFLVYKISGGEMPDINTHNSSQEEQIQMAMPWVAAHSNALGAILTVAVVAYATIPFSIIRYYVRRMSFLPTVDIHEVFRTGQLRAPSAFEVLKRYVLPCSKKSSNKRKRERPIIHDSSQNPREVITAQF